jgi:hypothetical protein
MYIISVQVQPLRTHGKLTLGNWSIPISALLAELESDNLKDSATEVKHGTVAWKIMSLCIRGQRFGLRWHGKWESQWVKLEGGELVEVTRKLGKDEIRSLHVRWFEFFLFSSPKGTTADRQQRHPVEWPPPAVWVICVFSLMVSEVFASSVVYPKICSSSKTLVHKKFHVSQVGVSQVCDSSARPDDCMTVDILLDELQSDGPRAKRSPLS